MVFKKKKKNLCPLSNQQNKKKEKVEKSLRIYDQMGMGTLAENQCLQPKAMGNLNEQTATIGREICTDRLLSCRYPTEDLFEIPKQTLLV